MRSAVIGGTPKSHVWANSSATIHRDNLFYLAMALACAAAIFGGFSRSFYLKAYFHTPVLPVLFHIHGTVMTLWILYFILQTWLVQDRRVHVHRRLGYAGAYLAGLMVFLGVSITVASARMGHFQKIPGATTPAMGCLFSLFDIALFAGFVWAGFHWRNDRHMHQRFMLLATIAPLIPSGVARLFEFKGAGAGPVILAFFIAGPVYDLVTRRRIHRAYIWGLLIVLLTGPPTRTVLSRTAVWNSIYMHTAGRGVKQATLS